MSCSEELAARIRAVLGDRDGVSERKMFGGVLAALAAAALAAATAATGAPAATPPPPRPFVTFDIAADLTAGDAGADVAGSSSMHYRCDAVTRVSDRVWFERRTGADGAWRRVEPAGVRYRLVRFSARHEEGVRVWRSSVRAPRGSFAGAGSAAFRLRSHMTFACGDSRVTAKWKTLPLEGLEA
jgi:hypothetical protein